MYLIDSPFGLPPLMVVREKIELFLREDIGPSDVATDSIVSENSVSEAVVVAKEEGLLAGLPFFLETMRLLDHSVSLLAHIEEGARISRGMEVVRFRAKTRALLSAERTALNLLQRLSGVATAVEGMVRAMNNPSVLLVDTRKTTPGLRIFEKYAVRVGGGANHRMGLFDCAMLKENHLKAAGGIGAAVERVRKQAPFTCRIEVETRNLQEVREAIDAGADIVMLDNFSLEEMSQAVEIAKGKAVIEASGGIDISNVAQVAQTGVQVISSGATVHLASWLDMSMLLV